MKFKENIVGITVITFIICTLSFLLCNIISSIFEIDILFDIGFVIYIIGMFLMMAFGLIVFTIRIFFEKDIYGGENE